MALPIKEDGLLTEKKYSSVEGIDFKEPVSEADRQSIRRSDDPVKTAKERKLVFNYEKMRKDRDALTDLLNKIDRELNKEIIF